MQIVLIVDWIESMTLYELMLLNSYDLVLDSMWKRGVFVAFLNVRCNLNLYHVKKIVKDNRTLSHTINA